MKTTSVQSMLTLSLIFGSSLILLPSPAVAEITLAQGNNSFAFGLNQAKNLARHTAEELNGGLGEYRAEPSMHGDPQQAPYVENADSSYTFIFQGRRPDSLDFTYESEVTIFPNETLVVDYNGAIRPGLVVAETDFVSVDLNQAKNLARQVAEEENGGLGEYRSEGSMHGNAQQSPYTVNDDGSYTFLFFGRRPESLDYTYETEVNVSLYGQTALIYNGMIREDVDITDLSEVSIDLNQAKNLARQTAEETNGGLGHYRSEGSMHGNPNEAPFVENADGSYTFTFQGRRPESLDFTYESQIKISADGQVEIIYNRFNGEERELMDKDVDPTNMLQTEPSSSLEPNTNVTNEALSITDFLQREQPLEPELEQQSP